MRRRSHALGLLAGVCLAASLLIALGGVAVARTSHGKPPDPSTNHGKPGKGKGRHKVTLCHKGKVTITVGAPAVPAHLKHGDTLGPCAAAPAPAPGTATLTVSKHVVNDSGGTKSAADFTLTINGVSAAGGNSFAGSEAGVTKTLSTVGAYSVTETAVPGYALSGVSADCSGTIALGEHKTCTLMNNDVPTPNGRLSRSRWNLEAVHQ